LADPRGQGIENPELTAASTPSARIACVSIVIPVYRDADRAIALVRAMQSHRLPFGVEAEIIVVDDGSGDGSANRIEDAVRDQAVLVKLAANRGRAMARNTGAQRAKGEIILFMDCDCLPVDDDLVATHLGAWGPGVVATIGPVVGNGDGFWHRYQSAASERRARQHLAGIQFSGSSQNLMVSRAAFEACGGFDNAFHTYGFEDRDLQIRLTCLGRIVWAAGAGVKHMDLLALPPVCRKMAEAGGSAALLFSHRHPGAYRSLGYAALDTRLHRWLRPLARWLDRLIEPMARLGDRLIASRYLPYWLKSLVVKSLTGISYLVGTTRMSQIA
jgi:glycosyltransferase involved in cell wall biosynthesis